MNLIEPTDVGKLEQWTAWISSPDLTVIIMDGLDRVGDLTALGDLGFGIAVLLPFFFHVFRSLVRVISRELCAGCCELLCVEVSFVTR